jgi:hypothetical protein
MDPERIESFDTRWSAIPPPTILGRSPFNAKTTDGTVNLDISRILAKWTSDGGRVNPGALPAQLERLEQAIGTPLPSGLRNLYSAANGMVDGTMESHYVNFWPIEKIVARSYVVESGPTKGIGFADILIDSWFLLLDVRASTLVVVNESTARALSLDQFWADYLDRPRSLDL